MCEHVKPIVCAANNIASYFLKYIILYGFVRNLMHFLNSESNFELSKSKRKYILGFYVPNFCKYIEF